MLALPDLSPGKNTKVPPLAAAALTKEWDKLIKAGVWDTTKVREWADVAGVARRSGKKAHVGRIFEICVEKNAELPANHPERKFKGRVVFQGNDVRDENWAGAMFQELGSSPATMQASKAADSFGLFEGHTVTQADAEQAYIQSKLGGEATWVRIPPNRAPDSWKRLKDPVCPLVLALYGHPDAGSYWEQHCEKALLSLGYTPIEGWRSCFFHKGLNLFLVVYVDDMKMAGPKQNHDIGWKQIGAKLNVGKPTPVERYLGCYHILGQSSIDGQGILMLNDVSGKTKVNHIVYDMEEFLSSCVDRYCELAGVNRSSLKAMPTPFIDESTPTKVGDAEPGELQELAARVLMKMLYAARMARFDLLRAINHLASFVTKWNRECDKKLHRLVAEA